MPELVRMALIGTGRAAKARVRETLLSKEARIVVVASPDLARAQEVAASAGAEATDDWRAAVTRTDVDAVVVSTHNQRHAECVRGALEAGKHVTVEYPLALAQAEGEALLALAKARGLVLHVEHIDLLSPWYRTLVEHREEIGELYSLVWQDLSTRQPTPRDWTFSTLSGFSLYAGASVLSRIVHLAGPASRVSASETLAGLSGDGRFQRRVTTAQLTFKPPTTALILDSTGLAAPGPQSSLTLTGGKGILAGENRKRVTLTTGDGGQRELEIPTASPGLFAQDIASFCGQVLRGTSDYVRDGHVSWVLDAAEQARRSAYEGSVTGLGGAER